MSSNVRKKKDEVALWEIVTTDRTQQPKRKPVQTNRSVKSIQIIGQDDNGYAVPRRQGNRQSRAAYPQENRQGRTPRPQESRQSRAARPQENRQNRAVRPQGSRQERAARAAQIKRRKAKKRRAYLYRAVALAMILCCCVLVGLLLGVVYENVQQWKEKEDISSIKDIPVFSEIGKSKIEAPEISTAFLEVNDYSRPGTPLERVKNIFVHYTANPRTSAAQNRSYFANLPLTKEREASAHYIIGYEGEIIQCIPSDEQAFAVKTRNGDSISIECCYLDKDGHFTQETYDSLVHMLAWLLQEYKLESSDILRHYDCGGKLCPLYYVEHEDAWEKLLADVDAYAAESK